MSLIGMHSAVRDGFTIPPVPAKWKYLKGSEIEFNGAFVGKQYAIKRISDGRTFFPDSIDDVDFDLYSLIGHREPITNVTVNISTPCGEDDLNDCIGQHHHREKVGELHIDGKVHAVNLGDGEIMSLIAERGTRYGRFKDGAEIMRDLKHVMHEVDGWNNLTPSQKEALDMIQHKIGRILNGDPNYDDNWKDIAGYSKLIADELNGEIK